ncbi:MAG TPA: hypothetical protein VK961_24575 [Chthoniobacter sp.]|nr:hypothetical protein [Chthoniobacter sp.]
MRFLNWNHQRVQNLTPLEIWGFIAGRVLMSFGLGVLAVQYYPQIAGLLGIPTLVIGILLLAFAAKGLRRKERPNVQQ